MTWYQLRPGRERVRCCTACGEPMRSSPAYDGGGDVCRRKRCVKRQRATVAT